MKLATRCIVGFAIVAILVTAKGATAGEPRVRHRNFLKVPVKFTIAEHREVYELVKLSLTIESVLGHEVRALLTPDEIRRLRSMGYSVERLPQVRPKSLGGKGPLGTYHDYAGLTDMLQQFATDYPDIIRLESIGQSVRGKELWITKITDNPDVEEDEPEFRYIANMHGDEVVGLEMCLYLINHLAANYGTDPDLTELVNEREIWIMPTMNPDGRDLRQRYNYSGVDLNRNFPVPDDSIGDDYTYDHEPETQAVIDFSEPRRFVLSANFHGGALVVNYPWDYIPDLTPDDERIHEVSLGYAALNPPMAASPYFTDGVVRGWEWYPVWGGLQDWSYHDTGCIDLTIELSYSKWPPEGLLPQYWGENRDAMLSLIRRSGTGLRGLVTDQASGVPVAAKVEILEIDKPVWTDADVGDYHRLLPSGTYTVRVEADGYHAQTIGDVVVDGDSSTRLDVQLAPIGSGRIEGQVTDRKTDFAIAGVVVKYKKIKPRKPPVAGEVVTDAQGEYAIEDLQPGKYRFTFKKAGYTRKKKTRRVREGETTQLDMRLKHRR